ncbi:hypothetical protein Elgi_34660 [Paenibacillus elgii]|nr:hypothetical protein Elgi_34660 [Paenibacillus elgii]
MAATRPSKVAVAIFAMMHMKNEKRIGSLKNRVSSTTSVTNIDKKAKLNCPRKSRT